MLTFCVNQRFHPRLPHKSHVICVVRSLPERSNVSTFRRSNAPFHLPYLLPSSVSRNSFVCHSYENCRGGYQQFPERNAPALVGVEHSSAYQKGTLMTLENSCSTISATSVLPHCRQRTPSGRRCRMAISDPDSGQTRRPSPKRSRPG